MMKHECDIVRDLLPLYAEKLGSEATTELVKEHLKGCPACRVELEKLRRSGVDEAFIKLAEGSGHD